MLNFFLNFNFEHFYFSSSYLCNVRKANTVIFLMEMRMVYKLALEFAVPE